MKFLQKIVLPIVVVALIFSFQANIASAQIASLALKKFSGIIITPVPTSILCPFPHTLIFDYGTFSTIGIAPVPGSGIFNRGNLGIPGMFVLGTSSRLPLPCLLPYPVYPIVIVGTS